MAKKKIFNHIFPDCGDRYEKRMDKQQSKSKSDIYPLPDSKCKCCNGSGVQTRSDGIKVRCPECNGSGDWGKPGDLYKIHWWSL